MFARDVRVNSAAEALVVEQALAMYRELKERADAAPDGAVLEVAELLAVQRGRELTRKCLETVLEEQAEAVEKKGLPAEPATAAERGGIGGLGRDESSRRRGR
jgi:hypothetical protein